MVTFQENQYIPVFLNTIRANYMYGFNIFLKLKGKFVLYHGGGENLLQEKIDVLMKNKVGVIYISQKEQKSYTHYLIDNLTIVITDSKMPVADKSKTIHYSIRSIANDFFSKPDIQSLDYFKKSITKLTDFILSNNEAIFCLVQLAQNNYEFHTHSINVGLLGTGLAKFHLAHDKQHNINNIATGLFLHDIGRCAIPEEIYNKRDFLNHTEWNFIKKHPIEGFRVISNLFSVTDEMKIIIMEHHERYNGHGYPRGLRGNQIHLYSKICSIADAFEAITSHRPYRKSVENTFNALCILKNEMKNDIEPSLFQNFVKLFQN